MNPKRIMMLGTMAIAITIGLEMRTDEARACASLLPAQDVKVSTTNDDFLRVLGASSDNEVYDALYNGKSLADIAMENDAEVDSIIEMQSSELMEQLDQRLRSGSLSPNDYLKQKSEIAEIVTNSVWGNPASRSNPTAKPGFS